MLYTIGNTKSYEENFKRCKEQGMEPPFKLGKQERGIDYPNGYSGGIVFLDEQSAYDYIRTERLVGYSVYGLKTDAGNIYWCNFGKCYSLLNSSEIVPL